MSQTNALFQAISAKSAQDVRALLEQDPELVKARNEHGFTPLHWAVHEESEAVAEALITHGAELEARDGTFGQTPLGFATFNCDLSFMKLLLSAGASKDAKDGGGSTPEDLARGGLEGKWDEFWQGEGRVRTAEEYRAALALLE